MGHIAPMRSIWAIRPDPRRSCLGARWEFSHPNPNSVHYFASAWGCYGGIRKEGAVPRIAPIAFLEGETRAAEFKEATDDAGEILMGDTIG